METRIMSLFSDGLYAYINDYYASKYGVLYKPNINYIIPNEDYISAHAKEIFDEIRWQKKPCEYSAELKEVAKDYLPRFFEKFPEYKNSECLKIREVNND